VPIDAPPYETSLVQGVSLTRLAIGEIGKRTPMLLNELPKKTVRGLRKSVTWTDITVTPASIALHRLMKGLARRVRWLVPLANLRLKFNAMTLIISAYIRRLKPTAKSNTRPFVKEAPSTARSPKGREHRRGERIQVDLPVIVSVDYAERSQGRVRNLSLSGALLKTDADLHLRALIEVCAELPPPSRHSARLLAHVSRRCGEDVGIEWCEFSPIVLKDLLRANAMWLAL
jgi:hypothetical protein